MQIFSSLSDVSGGFGPSAVTIGKFDGVHTGHRAVIDALRELGRERGLIPTVVTFDRHPAEVLDPEHCPDYLLSPQQKLEKLEEVGAGATLVIRFDRAFSQSPPEDFVSKVLVGALNARLVLVGSDFRYGARGSGNIDTLSASGAAHGFEVRLVDEVLTGPGRRASSSWVREALAAGDVREATEVLGYAPSVRSVVVPGERRGRELGFPTANLKPGPEGMIPADGIYAGWLTVDGETYPAAISVGNNPTFDGVPARQVEAYVLDQDFDLYGKTVTVAFAERLRGMVKFDSVDELIAQLGEDVRHTRATLGVS
ncbi:MAG: bifunctional riboflavin kinase/FAD synthetase [Homoserinimonas sp.]